MQQQEGFKKFLPHLLILAIFLAFSCAFCFPAFQGKTLSQHDIRTWTWSSQEGRAYYENKGENPLWANNQFSGMPQVQVQTYPDNNWFSKLNHSIQIYSGGLPTTPFIYFFWAMVCFYILMCTLKINHWIGAVGAIAFAFSTYNPGIITAGHVSKFMDIAYVPAILAGMIIAYRGKYIQGAAVTGLFMALFFESNHLQIIFYSIFLFGIFVLAKLTEAIKEKALKKWTIGSFSILLALVLALVANSSRLLQTQEVATYTTRGTSGLDKDYAFSWSNGVSEAFTILVPNLYGGSSDANIGTNSNLGEKLSELGQPENVIEGMTSHAPLYWGPQSFFDSVYFGAVICFLFVLAMFIIRSNMKWWLAGAALWFFLISMGKNAAWLNYFLFDHFPLFNKFRSPNMAISLASVIFPLLGMWALKDIYEEKIEKAELLKKVKLSLIITGGLCVAILLSTQMFLDFKGQNDDAMQQQYGQAGPQLLKAIRDDRKSAAATDAMRSLAFVLLAGGALWAYGKEKINKKQAFIALGLLVIVDLLPVAHRYLNSDDFEDSDQYALDYFTPSQTDLQILQDKDPYYRVFDLSSGDPFSDSKPSNFHHSIGGYTGAKLQVYQDLITGQLQKLNLSVLNMLNAKYIVVPTQGGQSAAQRNPGALGNAWFVSNINWVKDAKADMDALNAPAINNPMDTSMGNFNPAQTVNIRDTFKAAIGNYAFGKDSSASIQLTPHGYSIKSLKYKSHNSQNGLAVFSDIYYPIGWKATVDGKEVPIFRADYALRAIKIPAGEHTIEFSFESAAYKKGMTLGLIGSILLSLLIAAGVYFGFFAKNKEIA